MQIVALLVCCVALTHGASVVRVPRVYNILIKSDGALAPSEAVSADNVHDEGKHGDEEEGDDAASSSVEDSDEPAQPPLPILNAKEGAVQEGVNYTEVPLSRAYPLTRYTAPLIAAHYPFSFGGLILGPVPKLAAPQKAALQAEAQQRASVDYEEPVRSSQLVEQDRPIQQLPLPQYRANLPAGFRQRSHALPQGAFEDDDTESVRVEAREGDEEEEQA